MVIFKKGDVVIMSTVGIQMYTESAYNPRNKKGVIHELHSPGSTTHPIKVAWENGKNNQYRYEDLSLVSENPVIINNYQLY